MKYIVLLRGININEKNKISMNELKIELEKKYNNVMTYLNSGNIILESFEIKKNITNQILKIINDKFNLKIPIHILTFDELNNIFENIPSWIKMKDKAFYNNIIFIIPPANYINVYNQLGKISENIEMVKEYNNVVVSEVNTDKSPNIRNQYHLKGKYDAKVSVIFYNNGTLMVQGCITSFYVEFITEVLQAISSIPSEAIEEVFAIQARAGYALDNDLSKYIGNREHIDGSVIENFINTSINLANSAVKVDDYGCYTFGILKALDAVLRTRLLEDAPDFDEYGTYFQKNNSGAYCFKSGIGTYDNNLHLKQALEQGYSFFNQHRHSTFHVDSFNVETSRTLEYDEAVNIIKDCLVIINNICNNW